MNNPLLEPSELPPFSKIRPEHIKPAIESIIADNEKAVATLLSSGKGSDWTSLQEPLDQLDDRLGQAWSPVGHMNAVVNSEALREAYNGCLPLLSEYATRLGQNRQLFVAYQSLADSEAFNQLDSAQQKVINDNLRDFRLAGVALEDDKKARYGEIKKQLSELTSKFSDNVLDATMAWSKLITDETELTGLPESALAGARQLAESKEKEGWLLNLDFPSYFPVMTYCDNRELRKEVYTAFSTRASDQGPNAGEFDNTENIQQILKLRHELARLLGFENYAEYSLATKMAESPDKVIEFLEDLAAKSKPQAEKELAELKVFAKEAFGVEELEAWDVGYYGEKLRQQRYAISQEELRPWFPAEKTISGMFAVVNKLYGIEFQTVDNVDTWHKDVRFFNITRKGEVIGRFYLDLYVREHKRGGAWMDVCRSRWKRDDKLQLPVAYLTCNFTPPVGDKPALLTHDEVVTLFHEFGHGLHHMLTKVDYAAISGIGGVAWDAVELPSQFMENWCWEKEGLAIISGHFETGEPLPEAMLDKLLAAKNFQSAMMMVRQLEFSLFDFKLHKGYRENIDVQSLLDDVRKQVAVVMPPSFNRFQNSFSHIFAGGYAAGYYSYKWAEVLSADAFSRFEEEGIFNRETGDSFLHEILEQGGSAEPMELFVNFRGREPEIDALLRHSGIKMA
ncbi:oligopeptidase A [Endozoicomonas sp. SCSIO W0465]|uniref:oligopeptidase A n=1 Tax=Endozoicomonas sp. SCSIO W0465 TaxID=2918516 RepID=UPI0020766738|nr:oligopeptidase A [Endozoicomonas sp. SCSIO W0465]USE36658.1 oligopeptidase A [Endozoicomonas sp. SCSIO W0465]